MSHITFQRKIVAAHHVIVSKELPGLHVSGKTPEEAESALLPSLAAYLELKNGTTPVITGITLR